MTLNARNVPAPGGNRTRQPVLEAGGYPARVVQVVDLGLQDQEFRGEPKPPKHEIQMTYELLDEFYVDENGEEDTNRPRWVSERFPLHSLEQDKAKSTQRYFALDPDNKNEGDFAQLVETPCTVNLVTDTVKNGPNKGREFNKITGVTAMRAKDANKAKDLENDPVVFSLDDPSVEVFNSFPDFIKERITGNLEFEGSKLQSLLEEDGQDQGQDQGDDVPW